MTPDLFGEVAAVLRDCPLFDARWYEARYSAVLRSGLDALEHFVRIGSAAGLRPCPLFDTAWYMDTYPLARRADVNPLVHFVREAKSEGLKPNRLFDTSWYLSTYREARASTLDPLSHFLSQGWSRGYRPNVLFDTIFYCETYPAATRSNPLDHFLSIGAEENTWPNPFFDTPWYLARYTDARLSALDPLSHFRERGSPQNHRPNRSFDTAWYRATYLADAKNIDPLAHFIEVGASRDTQPNPLFDFDLLAGPSGAWDCRSELHRRYAGGHDNICAPAARARAGFAHRQDGPRALFVDGLYPRPNVDSGSLDTSNQLGILLGLGFAVTFVATAEFFCSDTPRTELERRGIDCVDCYEYPSVEAFLDRCGALFDVLVLSRVFAGGHFFELAKSVAPNAAFIFNTVDLHHVREAREAKLGVVPPDASLGRWTRSRELYLARCCDITIVVSTSEASLLRTAVPDAEVFVMPLLRDIPGRDRGFVTRRGIGFIGNFGHRPNVDAIEYFLDEIWPEIRTGAPDLLFEIVGIDMPNRLRRRGEDNVVFVGHVEDLAATLARWRLTVAPLRYGAGAKGKIVSSLAHGVPCVATPIAIEGMGFDDETEITVATDPRAFASAVLELLDDEAGWTAKSEAGLRAVRRTNDLSRGSALFAQLFQRIGVPVASTSSGLRVGG